MYTIMKAVFNIDRTFKVNAHVILVIVVAAAHNAQVLLYEHLHIMIRMLTCKIL